MKNKKQKRAVIVNVNVTLSAELENAIARVVERMENGPTFNETVEGPLANEVQSPLDFTDAMISVYSNVHKATGYRASRFLAFVRTRGGLAVARHLLASPSLSRGFEALKNAGRTDLSVEALVLKPEWSFLFTAEELAIAQGRLDVAKQLAEK
jgi:hypothetical protein